MLIPQAIAYATLAGMPPQTGLYAALLPSIVGMLWGSSALLAVGPVALTSLLTFGSLAPLAVPGTPQWVTLAIWLALYAGAIQFLLGAFRLGRIAHLVSQPVVTGFIHAAALIIIVSQLPALLGIDLSLAGRANVAIDAGMLMTTAFGGLALALLLLFRRHCPRLPGMLIVTLVGIAASWLLDFAGAGGAIVGNVPAGLAPLALPMAISMESHQALWPAALILALVSFTEAMSSCRVLARKQGARWDENQELIGQGLAKMTSGWCGAFPVSGSFSRSALNLYAGATSAWSTLFSALCVLLCLLFLTDFLYYLPQPVLGAMIIVPVFGLLDWRAFRRLFLISRDEGMVALVTFVVTLCASPQLQWGVFAGVALTMVSYLYRRAHPRIIEVGLHADGTLRDRQRFGMARLAPDVLAVRLDAALNFLTAAMLERFIADHLRADPAIRRVLLCAGAINDIDVSGVEMLEVLHDTLHGQDITLYVSALKKQVADVLERAGVLAQLGPERLFAIERLALTGLAAVPERGS